jgi:hypothetical protein
MLHASYNQVKPWSGAMPRLKRSHPLARNLISYMVDTGCGVVDLANPSAQTNPQTKGFNPPTDALNVMRPPRQSGINGPISNWSGLQATISIASPAVITMPNNFTVGRPLVFVTTGALPTGITSGTEYFVRAAGLSGSSFTIAITSATGAVVNTSGSQSGTHYVVPLDLNGQGHNSACVDPFRTTPWSNLSALGTGAGFSYGCACVYRGEGPSGGGTIYQSPVHANEGGQPFVNWASSFNGTTHGLVDTGGFTTSGNFASYGTSFQTTAFQYTSLLTTLVNNSPGSATGRLYANGALSGSPISGLATTNSTATIVPPGVDVENQLMLGADPHVQTSVSFSYLNGLVFYGAFWNRTLSAGEARLLHKFPWCMLETGNLRPVLDF